MVPPPPDLVALAVADEVRSQVAAVSVIAAGILATKGEFVSPQAIRHQVLTAIVALEIADLALNRLLLL